MASTGKHARENGPTMKKRILALVVAAMCCALVGGGTLAYFTAEERAHNVITSGGVDIELQELMVDGKNEDGSDRYVEFEDTAGVLPGTSASKIVQVVGKENTADAWVRVKVEQVITLADGTVIEGEETNDVLSLDYNTAYWMLENGFWYYTKDSLGAGEATEPLFTQVSFSGKHMDNPYQNANIQINVTAYAVQSANNGASALEAASTSWPIS